MISQILILILISLQLVSSQTQCANKNCENCVKEQPACVWCQSTGNCIPTGFVSCAVQCNNNQCCNAPLPTPLATDDIPIIIVTPSPKPTPLGDEILSFLKINYLLVSGIGFCCVICCCFGICFYVRRKNLKKLKNRDKAIEAKRKQAQEQAKMQQMRASNMNKMANMGGPMIANPAFGMNVNPDMGIMSARNDLMMSARMGSSIPTMNGFGAMPMAGAMFANDNSSMMSFPGPTFGQMNAGSNMDGFMSPRHSDFNGMGGGGGGMGGMAGMGGMEEAGGAYGAQDLSGGGDMMMMMRQQESGDQQYGQLDLTPQGLSNNFDTRAMY